MHFRDLLLVSLFLLLTLVPPPSPLPSLSLVPSPLPPQPLSCRSREKPVPGHVVRSLFSPPGTRLLGVHVPRATHKGLPERVLRVHQGSLLWVFHSFKLDCKCAAFKMLCMVATEHVQGHSLLVCTYIERLLGTYSICWDKGGFLRTNLIY